MTTRDPISLIMLPTSAGFCANTCVTALGTKVTLTVAYFPGVAPAPPQLAFPAAAVRILAARPEQS
jgi:hypothetical protein